MLEVIAIKRLRYIGITEGISSLLLFFVAMPLKYFMGLPEAVSFVGMVRNSFYAILDVAHSFSRNFKTFVRMVS